MSKERKDYNQIKKSKKSRSPVFRIIGILLGASLLGGSVFGAYYTDQTLGSGFYQSPHFASVIDRMVYAATEVITAERKGETQDPTGDPGQGLEPLDSQEEEKQEILQMAQLVARIIERRQALGLTQKQLAERAGLKQAAVARLESATTMPRVDTLLRVSNSLNMQLSLTTR